jgi:outer membrane protein assembly factor BamD (BamD/ComL family)
MSVSGLTSLSENQTRQQIQQEFQQLGQDLQAGNLSAAQSDFATLQQLQPQTNSTSSSQSNNPIAQAFSQLAQDLQVGNLPGAQQDYTTIQQDFQNQAAQGLQDFRNQNVQSNAQQVQQAFQQLGQDLKAGNLSGAQSDFATLQQLQPQTNSTSPSQSDSPIAQAFSQLAQDLQSGNLSGAQQAYTTIQQDFQAQTPPAPSPAAQEHHHHHGGGGGDESAITESLSELSQALQSDNLSAAQQAYSTSQQDFQQFSGRSAQATVSAPVSSNSVSVNG